MMYPNRFLHVLSMLLVLTFGCKKEEDDPRKFPKVELSAQVMQDSSGVTFSAEVTRAYGEIIMRGFDWHDIDYADMGHSWIFDGDNSGSLHYSATARTDLLKGKRYVARAFVVTNDHFVYSNEVEFVSEYSMPDIQLGGFSPSKAMWNDTVVISGKNFSMIRRRTRVMFGTEMAELLLCLDTAITVKVPHVENLDSVPVIVTAYSNSATFKEPFQYIYPQVLDFSPRQGTFLDTIIIEGRDIPPLPTDIEVKVAGIECPVVEIIEREIKVLVPVDLKALSAEIQVNMYGKTSIMEGIFTLLPAEISAFTPDVLRMPGRILTIRGKNFNPSLSRNQVSFDGLSAEVVGASLESLDVVIPMGLLPDPAQDVSKDITVLVEVANQPALAPASIHLEYTNIWSERCLQPIYLKLSPVLTSYKGKVHFGFGSITETGSHMRDMFEYDPETDTWIEKEEYPGSQTIGFTTSFRIGNTLYVCCGTSGDRHPKTNVSVDEKEVWAYNLDTDEWSRKSDFPGPPRSSAFGFSANGEGYMGGGQIGTKALFDFWKFDPLTDTWTQKEDIRQVKTSAHFLPPFAQGDSRYGYVLGSYRGLPHREFWRYDPLTEEWLELAPFPFADDEVSGFYLDGFIYAGDISATGSRFYRYQIASNTWESYVYGGDLKTGAVGIAVDEKAYLFGGVNSNASSDRIFWMLDPLKFD